MNIFILEQHKAKENKLQEELKQYGFSDESIKIYPISNHLGQSTFVLKKLPLLSSNGEYLLICNGHLLERLLDHYGEETVFSILREFGNLKERRLLYFYGDHSSRFNNELKIKFKTFDFPEKDVGIYADPMSLFDLLNDQSDTSRLIIEDAIFNFYQKKLNPLQKLFIGSLILNDTLFQSKKDILEQWIDNKAGNFFNEYISRKTQQDTKKLREIKKKANFINYLKYLPIKIDESIASNDLVNSLFEERMVKKDGAKVIICRQIPLVSDRREELSGSIVPMPQNRFIVIGDKAIQSKDECYYVADHSEPFKFYQALMEGLESAWKDIAFEATRLPKAERERFDQWLNNFKAKDLPHIFALMRYFRFYTAENLITLLDRSFNSLKADIKKDRFLFSLFGRVNKSTAAILPLVMKTNWAKQEVLQKKEGKDRKVSIIDNELNLRQNIQSSINEIKEDEVLHLVYVDDFIGSGGQLFNYLETEHKKIFGKDEYKDHLLEHIKTQAEEVFDSAKNLYCGFDIDQLKIHIIYLIGLDIERVKVNNYIHLKKAEEKPVHYCQISADAIEPFLLPDTYLYIVELCPPIFDINIEEKDYSEAQAQVTDKVSEIIYGGQPFTDNNCKVHPDTINKLIDYQNITKPREKEHALFFEPYGWKDCAGLVANYGNVPGYTLPIIWGEGEYEGQPWQPLFRRYFNPFDDGGLSLETFIQRLNESVDITGTEQVAFLLARFLKGKVFKEYVENYPNNKLIKQIKIRPDVYIDIDKLWERLDVDEANLKDKLDELKNDADKVRNYEKNYIKTEALKKFIRKLPI